MANWRPIPCFSYPSPTKVTLSPLLLRRHWCPSKDSVFLSIVQLPSSGISEHTRTQLTPSHFFWRRQQSHSFQICALAELASKKVKPNCQCIMSRLNVQSVIMQHTNSLCGDLDWLCSAFFGIWHLHSYQILLLYSAFLPLIGFPWNKKPPDCHSETSLKFRSSASFHPFTNPVETVGWWQFWEPGNLRPRNVILPYHMQVIRMCDTQRPKVQCESW